MCFVEFFYGYEFFEEYDFGFEDVVVDGVVWNDYVVGVFDGDIVVGVEFDVFRCFELWVVVSYLGGDVGVGEVLFVV